MSPRGALVALLMLSLVLLAPAGATVGAQGTPSPAASPVLSAGGEFIARFDAAAGELSEGVAVDADGIVYASLSPLGQLVRIGRKSVVLAKSQRDVFLPLPGLQCLPGKHRSTV